MVDGQIEYYRKRAESERTKARECDDPSIAQVHQKLAEEYERQTARIEMMGTNRLRVVED